jgi:cyclase
MISMKKIFWLIISLFIPLFQSYSQHIKSEVTINKEIPVGITRLSERVLVLTDVAPNGVVTAISTAKRIIIIDTGVSWSFGKGFRKIVEHEFNCNDDFIYVINTHADRDHTFGNQAFKDAIIVRHENCYKSLKKLEMEWDAKKDEYVSLHKDRAEKNIRELEETNIDLGQASRKRRLLATNNLIASDLSEGQEIILPNLTFNDQMTLYSGEITLHLYYLGEGHSDSDILIYVPQENIIVVGDAFIKSMLICYMKQDKFDMSKHSDILNAVLNDGAQIKYVVCGHGSIMTFDEILARRHYLNSLLKGIKQGYVNGMDLETIIQRFPLDSYSYLTRFIDESSKELKNQHIGTLKKYWSMLHGEEQSIQ